MIDIFLNLNKISDNFVKTDVQFSRYRDIWKEVQNERYIYYRKLFSEIFFCNFSIM